MEWQAEGILLSARRHGEHAAILDLFTAEHGRHLGVARGGASRRMAPLLQPGAQLAVTWRARLDTHLGHYSVEPLAGRAAEAMGDPLALAGLSAVCGLLAYALPERQAHPGLYARTHAILDGLGAEAWGAAYLGWEQVLLDETGFGLDLSSCAVTGARHGLAHVSPRSGRAVTEAGAGDYAERLLPLSPALLGRSRAPEDVLTGLRVTGHFLSQHLAPSLGDRPVPSSRARLLDLLERRAARTSP